LVVGFGIAKQVARNQAESDSNEMQKTRVLPWDYAKRAISIEVHRARRRDEHITLLKFQAPDNAPSLPEKIARRIQTCVRITDIVSHDATTCHCLLAGSKQEADSAKTRVLETLDVAYRGIEATVVSFPEDEMTFCGMLGAENGVYAERFSRERSLLSYANQFRR